MSAAHGAPLSAIAAVVGTPCYVYHAQVIRDAYRRLDDAFGDYPHAIHYAMKANSTMSIVELLKGLGAGVDANSMGEVDVAMRCGIPTANIVFTGVGKSTAELNRAVTLGFKAINVESPGELDRLDQLALAHGTRVRVALRVNPDIDARSHPHISTGRGINKFGIPLSDVRALCRSVASWTGLDVVGLHVHVGSQILDLEPLRRAATALVALARELRDDGTTVEHLDLGGGLGISYQGQPAPSAADYAAALLPIVRESGASIILEPGRAIVGPAGALVARVVDIKPQAGGKQFMILDAGMTELIRPMLYGAFHRIEMVSASDAPAALYDVVGPLCESSDTLGTDRSLPSPRVGELMAILDAGAYASVMASNYNRRTLPAEVMVQDGRATVIRRRQTIDDLVALET